MQTSPIIEKLAKLPRGQRFLVYLVVWLLTGAIFFFGLYMPAQNEVASLKTNRVNLERQKAPQTTPQALASPPHPQAHHG